jgi:hypothetical protein
MSQHIDKEFRLIFLAQADINVSICPIRYNGFIFLLFNKVLNLTISINKGYTFQTIIKAMNEQSPHDPANISMYPMLPNYYGNVSNRAMESGNAVQYKLHQ